MTIEDAFQRFRASALSRGYSDIHERAHPEAFGSRVCTLVHQGNAGLRLVWDGKEETLRLEVAHGPEPESPVGWLDLYQASQDGDCLRSDESDITFTDALEYGFDLLLPRGSVDN